MKIFINLFYSVGEKEEKQISNFLLKIGGKKFLSNSLKGTVPNFKYLSVELDKDSDVIRNLISSLKKMKKGFSYRIVTKYSDDELLQCRLLFISINRSPKGYGGPTYGTKYNIKNTCKICGSGAIQTSNLMIRPSDIPKTMDIYQTLNGEIIISKKIAQKLKMEKLKGFDLRPVMSYIDKRELDYYQIIPYFSMPRLSNSTKCVKKPTCKSCKRSGFGFNLKMPNVFYYNLNEGIINKADIFFTYEHFGIGVLRRPFNESVFAQPHLLVKPTIFKIFKELKINYVDFQPVIINGKPNTKEWLKKN